MDRDDGVLAVVFAAEHLLDLAGLHFLIERVEGLREFRIHRLAGFRPLDEHTEVVALLLQRVDEIAVLLQSPSALQNLLGFGLIFPEIRCGGFRFELSQLLFRTGGFKDSSANQRLSCSDPDSGASTRRLWAWRYCT